MTLIRKNTTLAKTVTFAAVHFTVAFSVGYLLTGSVAIAGALALLEPLANTLAYYGHERLWARMNAGQTDRLLTGLNLPFDSRCTVRKWPNWFSRYCCGLAWKRA